MKNISVFYLAVLLILFPAFIFAQSPKKRSETLEQQIRRLDLSEAEAILKKDFRVLYPLENGMRKFNHAKVQSQKRF